MLTMALMTTVDLIHALGGVLVLHNKIMQGCSFIPVMELAEKRKSGQSLSFCSYGL